MYWRLLGLLGLQHVIAHALPSDSATQTKSNTSQRGYTFGKAGVNATYDYVIVGGGTAGLTLATRLAENTGTSVAVIEAGGFYEQDNGNQSVVPGYDANDNGLIPGEGVNPLIDWNFNTTSLTVSCGGFLSANVD